MGKRPQKAERRRSILQAARSVFCARGYAATRMSDVAGEAGVGKGTLYEHFKSKEELFSTLVVTVLRESMAALARVTRTGEPKAALEHTLRYVVDVALGHNLDLYRLFFDYWGVSAGGRTVIRAALREEAAAFRALLAELFRRGRETGSFDAAFDPDLLARALLAAVDGLSLQLVIQAEKLDLKEYADTLYRLFANALTAGPDLGGASLVKERE